MKHLFRNLANKANELLDGEVSTRGRSKSFQITVLGLLAVTASFTIYNMLKTIL